MKKFVCLLLVAMLALSLGVAVFARADVCPSCSKGTLRCVDTERTGGYDSACRHGKSGITYYLIDIMKCTNCTYGERWNAGTETVCNH